MFYKVSYNQGFCSLLGLGTVLKKKSQYSVDGAEYCDFTFLLYEFIFLLYVFIRYSLLSTSIRSRESHRCGRGR